ncbi:MAG: CoA pyrophosphatase [Acidimicrobiia bacterium]|nr:CoA pyrophosphatase [Acidimicrobiia bacterium]
MRYDDARRLLETKLLEPLPGPRAQQHLAPIPPRDWPAGFTFDRLRHAAGLLLVFPLNDLAHVVLTQRANTLDRHGGQISLPGGVVESGETFAQAALREAREEIALAAAGVRTLGALTPVDIQVSGFRLHPIVGISDTRPLLRPADGEVARVIEIPVGELLDPGAFTWQTLHRGERTFQVPTLVARDARIWGATAMVIAEFLSLLGWRGRPAE